MSCEIIKMIMKNETSLRAAFYNQKKKNLKDVRLTGGRGESSS